ncbi:MAG: 2-amino-4-hydroxy-6-hydroxymethyldihydropteridine diphosphokinase [Candidatus Bipolaricaulis sp.]|nr:2-amino-4-hydroxy-6-hydroxymethyldihydropteridine diphosphokinase [Candidatus Bipolaricaulis sp.]
MDVYILFGSNLGDRRERIERGLARVAQRGVRWTARSSIYETEPVGLSNQPWFLNLVARGTTPLSPQALLAACKDAETAEGRVPTVRFGPRTLDVDILLYGTQQVDEPNLSIPHPRMNERRFVLTPLVEIAPDLSDPRDGRRFAEVLAGLDEGKKVLKSTTRES